MEENGRLVCDAGRRALLNMAPCGADLDAIGRVHVVYIGDVDTEVVKVEFCDLHFDFVNAIGLIDEPYAGRDVVRQRIGREPD